MTVWTGMLIGNFLTLGCERADCTLRAIAIRAITQLLWQSEPRAMSFRTSPKGYVHAALDMTAGVAIPAKAKAL